MTYALDTNTIIDYLNGRKTVATKFLSVAKSNTPMVIPIVVDYEVMRGFYHTPCSDRETVYSRIKMFCPVVDVTADMWDCAVSTWAKLKKSRITIGDADLIIASQCIVSGYTIVTRNVKHFNPINGLPIENWAV